MKYITSVLLSSVFVILFASISFSGIGSHPRLFLNTARVQTLVNLATANDAKWTAMLTAVNGTSAYFYPSERLLTNALAYKIKLAKGDTDATDYSAAAIDYLFNGRPIDNEKSLIETGTITSLDINKMTDSTKSWGNLDSQRKYLLNPDITQNNYWHINRGYGSDTGKPINTATEFYVHPSPSTLLNGATSAQPRSIDITSTASVGSTYVIGIADGDKTKVQIQGIAIAYDWLYDALTAQQRNVIKAYLKTVAQEMMVTTYGPEVYAWHNYTVDVLRDLAAIGYALYGDDPMGATILAYVHDKYTTEVQSSMNWIMDGGEWPEGGAYGSRITTEFLQFLWMVKTSENIDYFTPSATTLKARLDYTLLAHYPAIYTGTTAGGSIKYKASIIHGDGAREQSITYDFYRIGALMTMAAFPTSREAKTAMTFFTSDGLSRVESRQLICWELLFYDPAQATLALDTNAPVSNLAQNGGVVQMRSAWTDANPTIAEFKSGPHTHYHGHLDANSFQIYKYADLAADTGTYSGSGGGNGAGYYVRTVAHNAMLFYDPAEASWQNIQSATTNLSNDGGQREVRTYAPNGSALNTGSWQTTGLTSGDYPLVGNEDIYQHGQITKYGADSNYVYTVGDATKGYDGSTHKVTKAVRKFLYLRPDVFVVNDVFTLKNTSIEPNFVLHSVDTLTVNGTETTIQANGQYDYSGGNTVTVGNGGGKLVMNTVYPASVAIRKIGGANRRYWVDGANRLTGSGDYGLWRAEVRPSSIETGGQMINVLQTSSTAGSVLSTALINGIGGRGVLVGGNTIAMFTKDQSGANISRLSYTANTSSSSTHYIADLAPLTAYNISINGGANTAYTASSAGIITFTNSATGLQIYSVVQSGVKLPSAPKIIP